MVIIIIPCRASSRRKSHAAVDLKDPLGLGIIEKRVLIPPISPGKRRSPEVYGNSQKGLNAFSSVSDLAGIKDYTDEDPFGNFLLCYFRYLNKYCGIWQLTVRSISKMNFYICRCYCQTICKTCK